MGSPGSEVEHVVKPQPRRLPGPDTLGITNFKVSTGLASGLYEGVLCVASNDPVIPLDSIPVIMQVNDLIFRDRFEVFSLKPVQTAGVHGVRLQAP